MEIILRLLLVWINPLRVRIAFYLCLLTSVPAHRVAKARLAITASGEESDKCRWCLGLKVKRLDLSSCPKSGLIEALEFHVSTLSNTGDDSSFSRRLLFVQRPHDTHIPKLHSSSTGEVPPGI